MNLGAGFDSVQLDLLDVLGLGGTLAGKFGGAGADAGVGGVDVVVEDFLGVVVGCGYSRIWCQLTVCVVGQIWGQGIVRVIYAYRLKNRPTPSLPSERQYCSSNAWCTHCLA